MSGACVDSRASQHQLVVRRGAVDQDADALADPARVLAVLTSRFCRLITASRRAVFDRRRHIVVERVRRRAFLVRVGEHADVVERVVADETRTARRHRASVSPGKPTMKVVRRATPGTRSRMRSSSRS